VKFPITLSLSHLLYEVKKWFPTFATHDEESGQAHDLLVDGRDHAADEVAELASLPSGFARQTNQILFAVASCIDRTMGFIWI
jgi:hypothetical protein